MTQRTSQSKIGINQPGQPRPNICVVEYDFAKDGGAQGDITLRGDTIPSGAYIFDADIIVETVPVGATATIAIKTEAAADINAADAISGAPWSAVGIKKADKMDAADEGVKTTADRAVKATIGTADLTAGKFKVVVSYWLLA